MRAVKRWLAGLLLLGLVCASAWAEDAEECVEVLLRVRYAQTEMRAMLEPINELRMGDEAWYWNSSDTEKVFIAEEDRYPLVYDCELEKIAMQRAAEIALRYAHERPNGTSCFSAYPAGLAGAKGENIAASYGCSAERVFQGWREDDKTYEGQGHRRNMLSTKYNRIGIAHVVYNGWDYWVQELAYVEAETETTEPLEEERLVAVELLPSFVSEYTFTRGAKQIEVREEKQAQVPSVSVQLSIEKHYPSSAKVSVQNACEYQVENEDVARLETVEGQAFLRGVSAGETRLIVRCLGQTITIPVKVQERVRISLSASRAALRIGETVSPVVAVKNAENRNYFAQSSQPAVVSVENGVLQARGVGSAVITYTAAADETEACELSLTVVDEAKCVALPKTTRRLEAEALYGVAATRVELPSGMEEIAEGALACGDGLQTVAIYGNDLIVTEKMLGASANATILCGPGSAAETYASENGLEYLLLK